MGTDPAERPANPEIRHARTMFLESVEELRPRLHRYCTRILGSALDGEDVVQEVLARAWFNLPVFDGARPLEPWLFRIAHNRCIDWVRRDRGPHASLEPGRIAVGGGEEAVLAAADSEAALRRLVLELPPKERACVVLKDVLDMSLKEIAEIVDSTVGGVKSALHRGREKLAAARKREGMENRQAGVPQTGSMELDEETEAVLRRYIDRFNARDWDGLEAVVAADARLEVPPLYDGLLENSPYHGNYQSLWDKGRFWRFTPARIDGELALVRWTSQSQSGPWTPTSITRIEIEEGRIRRIRDYFHQAYILDEATVTYPWGAPD